jgi:catechol 2,3-dioxygenase-like lactoylglutathione lyase family enzyme
MIPVQRIGHATFETADLDRQVDYYTQVIGLVVAERTQDRAVLASRLGYETLLLERGTAARCTRLSFALPGEFDLDLVALHMAKIGITAGRRRDITPAIRDAAVFADPKGTEIELFAAVQHAVVREPAAGVAPMKLGHVAFGVLDAEAMTAFYVDHLGFRVSDWMEDFFAFLRCGPDHHTVNFRTSETVALAHIAFELKDWAHIQVACDTLGRHKRPILWGPLRHGIGHNIAVYHRDPDDNAVEFYTEMDQMKNEALGYFDPRPWHEDRPQRPKVWDRSSGTMIWGLQPDPDYVRGRLAAQRRRVEGDQQ